MLNEFNFLVLEKLNENSQQQKSRKSKSLSFMPSNDEHGIVVLCVHHHLRLRERGDVGVRPILDRCVYK